MVSINGVLRIALLYLLIGTCALQGANFGGIDYQGVRATGKSFGLTPAYAADLKSATIKGNGHTVKFTTHQKYAIIDEVKVWMCFPMAENKNLLYLSTLDRTKTLAPLIQDKFKAPYKKLWHIVIDPGHGGKDTGARNTRIGINEKTLVLDIAQRTKQQLEAYGYKVTLTRTTDKFLPLKSRAAFANRLKADLFISIHLNAAENTTVKGIETFCYTPQGAPSSARSKIVGVDKKRYAANKYDTHNLWLAYEIQKSMNGKLPSPDRGVKRARFTVLEDLKCPGVLIESGFVSNSIEGTRLNSTLYRQNIAEAITKGVINYHRRGKSAR